jgi:hypothetical protein
MKPLKQRSIWLVLSLLVLFMQASAQEKAFDPSVLSAEGNQAYQALTKVDTFAIGGVGYAVATSVGEKSLDVLIGEDKAVSALKGLIDTATPEGGLYAVLGLKTLKCECLETEVKRFNARSFSERERWGRTIVGSEDVTTMSGCIVGSEKKSDVLKEILTGNYDEWVNHRTINRWSKEKGK